MASNSQLPEDLIDLPIDGATLPDDLVDIPISQESSFGDYARTATLGVGQGASFGAQPVLAGAVGAIGDFITDPQARSLEGLKRGYQESRDFATKLNESESAARPVTYGLSEVAGAIASPINKVFAPTKAVQTAAGAKVVPTALGRLSTGAADLAGKAGASRGVQGLVRGAIQAAPPGALYAGMTSEGDLTEGEFGEVASDAAKGAALTMAIGGAMGATYEVAKPYAKKLGQNIRNAAVRLKEMADDILHPAPGAGRSTGGIEKRIEKTAQQLESVQAAPEAKILREMAEAPGTPAGIAKRQSALMSPLTMEEKNKTFYNKTKDVFNTIDDNFWEFENNVRFAEAEANLANVPANQAKKAAMRAAVNARATAKAMSSEANKRKFNQATAGYLEDYSMELAKDVSQAKSSYEVYRAVNNAKKKIANNLADYGETIGPLEKGTIKAVQDIEGSLTSILEDQKIFGQQAMRHKDVNDAYKGYLRAKDNMQRTFMVNKMGESGRPVKDFASSKFGQYSRQIHNVHGEDKAEALENLLSSAENLSKTMDTSAYLVGGDVSAKFPRSSQMLGDYRRAKTGFQDEMTLARQMRQLRWDKAVQNAADAPNLIEMGAEKVASKYVPGFDMVKGAIDKQKGSQAEMSGLIRELLNRETQPSAGGKIAAGGMSRISDVLQKTPEAFGKFSSVLSSAASRGPAALSSTVHVLNTRGGADSVEFRKLQRQLTGQEGPNER